MQTLYQALETAMKNAELVRGQRFDTIYADLDMDVRDPIIYIRVGKTDIALREDGTFRIL